MLLLLPLAFNAPTRWAYSATLVDEGVVPLSTAWRDDYRRPPVIPYPESSQFTAEKAKLGEVLFFDPMLSGSSRQSCATCHDPAHAYAPAHATHVRAGSTSPWR